MTSTTISEDTKARLPRKAVEAAFAGVMACGPDTWRALVADLADTHGVPFDQADAWIGKILREMPPVEDW